MELLLPALLLGAVQGLTEFLPVSSTAHLVIIPQLAGWNHPLLNSQAFDVALHIGTLLALLWVYGDAWINLLLDLRSPEASRRRLGVGLLLATLPALVAGALLEHTVARHLRGPLSVAAWMVLGGLALAFANARPQGTRTGSALSWREALLIGCAQAVAILPGFSRSGATITAGLLLGMGRAEATRYSFLSPAPGIAAACVWEVRTLVGLAPSELGPMAAGIVVSGLTGALAIRWLIGAVSRMSFRPFVWYRLALGAGIAVWALAR